MSLLPKRLVFVPYVRNSAQDKGFYSRIAAVSKLNLQSWPRQRKLETFSTHLQKVCIRLRGQPAGGQGASRLWLSGGSLLMWASRSGGFSQTPQQTHALTMKEEVMKPRLRNWAHLAERNHPANSQQQRVCPTNSSQSQHLVP